MISLEYRRTTVVVGFLGAGVLLVLVTLLLWLGGDHRSRQGATVAAGIAAFAIAAPVVLAFLGQDYFLSRNVIPAFIPLLSVVAIACVVPRARILGGALAITLLAVFSVAAFDVQTRPYLERPDWRNVARALGDARAPRAIIAADGFTADPLKIYMPGVNWVQPQNRPVKISEVDVVGATKRLALLEPRRTLESSLTPQPRRTRFGSPVPALVGPPGDDTSGPLPSGQLDRRAVRAHASAAADDPPADRAGAAVLQTNPAGAADLRSASSRLTVS